MSKIIIGHATVCRACNNGAPFRYGAHTINRQEFRLTEFAALREAVADEWFAFGKMSGARSR